MAEKVVRGKIISSDGKVLAQTLTENGSEIRDYPYGRMFAHVVGYNDKGKSGLESVCNFDLLKSDANLMTQITSSLKGEKSIGDNVYTTLNTKVQKAAYYALQGQKGAVVAMDPETGKIQTRLQTSLRQRKLDRIKYKQEFFVVKPCNARIISARINI